MKTSSSSPGKSPLVSIVMPSFNQAAFIRESIDSVVNQDYPGIELIIIDGGSTDDTVDILKSYGDKITYWVSEADEGQSDALNKGLEVATGDLVGWMNADDLYLPGAISEVVKVATKFPEKLFFHGNNQTIDEKGNVIGRQLSFRFSTSHLQYEGFHTFTQSFFWRRVPVAKQYTFPLQLHRTMDYHFMLWAGLTFGDVSFKHINRDMGAFRRHAAQKTTADGSDIVDEEHKFIERDLSVSCVRNNKSLFNYQYYRFRRAFYYLINKAMRY